MAKRQNILPFAPIGALIVDATGKRVAKEAKVVATKILEDIVEKVIFKANLLAEHSNRKTIKAKDVALAFNQLKGDL